MSGKYSVAGVSKSGKSVRQMGDEGEQLARRAVREVRLGSRQSLDKPAYTLRGTGLAPTVERD